MRVALSLSLLLPIACSFHPAGSLAPDGGDPSSGPWLAGYGYRKTVTVSSGDHAALAQFPVAIVEHADRDLAMHAGSDGGDLVVTGDDGVTPLPRELVAFDHGSGAVELWVRVPMLAAGTQELFLYYGGPRDATSAKDVWSAGFAAVWHLADFTDSTGHGHTLAATPNQVPGAVDGLAGMARSFDSTTQALATAAAGLDFPTSSFGFSMWLKLGANPTGFVEPLFHGGTSLGHPGYSALAGTQWVAKAGDHAMDVDAPFGTATSLVGDWHQLAGMIDRSAGTITAYADGVANETDSALMIGSIAGSDDVELGRSDGAQFTGLVDEVRIYDQAVPTGWFAVEHANLSDPGFAVVSSERAR